jgi:chlorobactene glucosyltransferase
MSAVFYYILLIIVWSTVGLWTAAVVWTWRELKVLKPLRFADYSEKSKEPFVSVLLPARNEEKRILTECVQSLLAQDYHNYEIIAVNDRSTDRTGEILRGLAEKDVRLKVIEGSDLPAGWLGKPFVMQQAFLHAGGEWILTTDADIVFSPDTIKTTIAYAQKNSYDALTLIPFDICESFWERLFLPTFSWFRMLAMPPSRVNNPQKPETMGVGNFFLVRREYLEKIGGFEAVKSEVAEDLKFAQLLKQSGARFRLDYTPDLIKTRMYNGLREIWEGFTKNLFAASNFSVLNIISGAGSILLFGVLPNLLLIFCLLAFLTTNQPVYTAFLPPLGFIYILQTIVFLELTRAWQKPFYIALFAPLGLSLFAAIMINSTVKILSGRGVTWKGRAIYQRNGNSPST